MTPLKFLTLSLVATATGFQFRPNGRLSTGLKAQIDEAKIKDAAENFGKYSLKEIEAMKNELHTERIQSLMFDRSNSVNAEKAAEQRLMEQELDLQLSLLKKDLNEATPKGKLFPDSHDMTMFPEVEEDMAELPHLKDGTLEVMGKKEAKLFFLEEAFFEENVVETIAFCSILALLMIAPQIL